ncbi:hypothetical protein CsSME_00021828 [Camellia sinensis var. sinensis]
MEVGMQGGRLVEPDSEIVSPTLSADEVSHLAVDIGGSLIKLVYSSINHNSGIDDKEKKYSKECSVVPNGSSNYPVICGRLHFAKFETNKINDCVEFILSKQLHHGGSWHHETSGNDKKAIKVVGLTSLQIFSRRSLVLALTRWTKWIVLWLDQIFCLRKSTLKLLLT